jgi:serine/threonine-protein kinase
MASPASVAPPAPRAPSLGSAERAPADRGTERVLASAYAGRVIGGYTLERPLGRGAMSEVWLAEHVFMRKRCALKLLDARIATPEIVARFEREAVAAAKIAHPAVVAATDFGREGDGTFYLVLEYAPGRTLRALTDEGPIEPHRALRIARQILAAAAAAHEAGIIHRDLKPENVVVQEPGDTVKVLDFGVAKLEEAGNVLTRAGALYGTPAYMAPEQALGSAIDRRVDLYAIGIILHELVTGRPPFVGSDLEILTKQIYEPLPSLAATDAAAIEPLVAALTAKEREARPASVAEVVPLLDEAERRLAPRSEASTTVVRRRTIDRRLIAIAVASTVITIAGSTLLLTRAPTDAETPAPVAARATPSVSAAASTSASAVAPIASEAPSAQPPSSTKPATSAPPKPSPRKAPAKEKGLDRLKSLFK